MALGIVHGAGIGGKYGRIKVYTGTVRCPYQ